MSEDCALGVEIARRLSEVIECWLLQDGIDQDYIRTTTDPEFHPSKLLNICEAIETKAPSWAVPKLFLRLGFVQGVLVALKIVSLEDIKRIIRDAHDHLDLLDHHDPASTFYFDLGGGG